MKHYGRRQWRNHSVSHPTFFVLQTLWGSATELWDWTHGLWALEMQDMLESPAETAWRLQMAKAIDITLKMVEGWGRVRQLLSSNWSTTNTIIPTPLSWPSNETVQMNWMYYLFGEDSNVLVEGFRRTNITSSNTWVTWCACRQFTLFKDESEEGEERMTEKQFRIRPVWFFFFQDRMRDKMGLVLWI